MNDLNAAWEVGWAENKQLAHTLEMPQQMEHFDRGAWALLHGGLRPRGNSSAVSGDLG